MIICQPTFFFSFSQAEKLLKVERSSRTPALAFPSVTPNHERDIGAEVAAAVAAGSDLDHVVGKAEQQLGTYGRRTIGLGWAGRLRELYTFKTL